jgi:hypothetical protein
MEIFIIWFGLSLIAGYVGGNKGHSGVAFFLLSLILSPLIGLVWAIVAKDIREENALKGGDMKKCPSCAELIKSEAIKCKHCGETFSQDKNDEQLNNLINTVKSK